ncbi:alpha/beta hydrolase family protein [Lacinutrix iliipiscaria]|uniref:Alpha/beta hydrolase family protein n=1 Tax=Lacinutrix iliipiscaria TaxID=1230532 RepID=A0ABW5WIM7_9FLAO
MKLFFYKKVFFPGVFGLIVCFSSCKEKLGNTFHHQIISQQLLNTTEAFHINNIETYKINYISDDLAIEGYIAKPKQTQANSKLPAIVFCRGGNQSYGMILPNSLNYLNFLASEGYVVLASQLRGNIASEGVDEFGGKDLNDILKLISIARDLDFVDPRNIHVLGYSRGGMNTYQISKLTNNINSLAVVGAPSNLFEGARFRQEMYDNVMKPLIGDSIQFKNEYIKRSAVYWHNKINKPVLILHGTDDKAVTLKEAQQIIDSLKISNKTEFQYEIFEGGNHSLSNFKQRRNDLIFNWFNTHNK